MWSRRSNLRPPFLGNIEFVRLLLRFCPQISMCRDSSEVTPLHSACLMGRTEIAALLLRPEYCVDVDAMDATEWTPFMYAVYAEHEQCALLVFRKSKWRDIDQICSLEAAVSDPDRMEAVLSALATIPDFFSLLNRSLRDNMHYLQGKLQFLLDYPFLLDVENRLAVARVFVENSLDREYAEAALSICDPEQPTVVQLTRTHVWRAFLEVLNAVDTGQSHSRHEFTDDSDDEVVSTGPLLQRHVIFQFLGESGIGQGVEREVLEVLSTDIVTVPRELAQPSGDAGCRDMDGGLAGNTSSRLFSVVEGSPSQVCVPSTFTVSSMSRQSDATIREDPAYFEFGQLVGHLLLRQFRNCSQGKECAVLSVNISECFWKLVCDEPVSLHDVASVDSVLYKNWEWLLSNDGADALDLSFTASNPTGDIVDLKRKGSKIAVTDKNKEEYVQLLIEHTIVNRMSSQAELTCAGICSIIPQKALNLFSGVDISLLVTGVVEVDVCSWKSNTGYSGYCEDNRVVQWFWEFVRGLDATQRSLLLRYVTYVAALTHAEVLRVLLHTYAQHNMQCVNNKMSFDAVC